jgi:fatty acid synthase
MDISSELGVASVDGAAEASIRDLSLHSWSDKVAPNYKAFGPVLSDMRSVTACARLFGAAGVKPPQITRSA